jgi:hypothetical protein
MSAPPVASDNFPFPAAILRLIAPLIVWTLHLSVLYGGTALACARGFDGDRVFGLPILSFGIGTATVIALGGVGYLMARAYLTLGPGSNGDWPTRRFVSWLTLTAGALAIVAIIWEAVPVLIVPACA